MSSEEKKKPVKVNAFGLSQLAEFIGRVGLRDSTHNFKANTPLKDWRIYEVDLGPELNQQFRNFEEIVNGATPVEVEP